MAPKEPYAVHSLSKHVENTKKGLAANAQASRRPAGRSAAIKKESNPNNIFANNSDDDDEGSGSGSDSDSSEDAPVSFMDRLVASDAAKSTPAKAAPVKSTPASRRRSKDDEIADSDDERNASKKASVKKPSAESESSSSDSESDQDTNTKTNGAPVKAVESDSSSSESGSESDSDDEDAKDAPAAKASTKKKDDSESSSEEESEDEADSKPKPAVNGTAATTTSTSSSESSEDESESESEEEQVAKPATKTAKTAAKPAAPEPESSSSEDEDSDEEMVDESMHIEDREGQVAVPTFMAPDFVLRKGDDGTNGKDVAEVCNKANLEGKQFWYFTVPSNVPISVVQNLEIPMNQSSAGNKLFSHDGEDYGFSFESIAPRGNIQIMIPSADASQYRSAPKQVDQMMQVKKITQLGSDTSVGPAPKPAPRAQPAGLRARYQPIGVNEPMVNASDEDVEMAEAPATSTKASKKEKKRKESSEKKHKKSLTLPERPSSQTVEAPTPDTRKNKRKLAASEDDATAVAEQLQQEAKSAVKKSKKQKTDRAGSPELGSESVATKKQTPVLPPSIPVAGASTPKPAATPATTSKKQKKVKETPVPAPRMSAVPIPSIPHSSPPKSSPAPPASQPPTSPIQAKEKRSKKSKDSKKTSSAKKETPVLPSMPGSSSE
ncbi:uncharacterized protein FIESC28_08941 [Fusarium coffeatum]|uniref:Uncharacterized protein n=1 Tax=Fusarium coffeatum TaxID=231269 RepID=A0A366R380_9HYPO|nr:uncharacterized protein FIESC28_08941 [Fusarium coffeatum]RBR11607.1 hypothetical protein FIESC28_08941 [Fusarium coffeatum]